MQEKIKQFLKDYRHNNKKTQEEMAALLEMPYRTYQNMELSGEVKKLEVLNKLKEKIGFGITPKNVHNIENNIESESDLLATIRDLSYSGAALAEANKTIAEANNTIAAANKVLSENNKELINLLLKSPDLSDVKESQLTVSAVSRPTLEKMAAAGIPDLWKSMDEGLVTLGKLLIGGKMVKQE